jgi:hypothetical protein
MTGVARGANELAREPRTRDRADVAASRTNDWNEHVARQYRLGGRQHKGGRRRRGTITGRTPL